VPLVGIWIPSLVTGGLRLWQVLPLPALLLLASRLGLWAWAADLLKTWRSALGLLACGAVASVWLAGNLVSRAIEIADFSEPFDTAPFLASFPSPDQNRAGALIHGAAQELMGQERPLEEKGERLRRLFGMTREGLADGEPGADSPPGVSAVDPIARIVEQGWPEGDAELDSWLEQMCRGQWLDHLREAAALPLGIVEHPRLLSGSTRIETKTVYQRLAQLLVARALQVQARGDHDSALDPLLWALALSRNLRYQTVAASYLQGQGVEAFALQGLDRWLDRLGPQPHLLQRALGALNRHEEETPPPTDPIKAEYLILRERLDDPARWLVKEYYSATAGLERDLITLALQTPWEKERAARFLDALTNSRLKEARTPYWQLPLQARVWNRDSVPADEACLVHFTPSGKRRTFASEEWVRLLADSRLLLRLFALWPRPQPLSEAFSLCRVRGARLKLALALYQAQEGKPAPDLAHLVPHYLKDLPPDPFSGEAFHYRVSARQRMQSRRRGGDDGPAWTDIPDRAIVWSIGPEATVRSGRRGTSFHDPLGQNELNLTPDQVFIVPTWPQ
jgi:hypothetical protein